MINKERGEILKRGGIADIFEGQKIFGREFALTSGRKTVSPLAYKTADRVFPYLRLITKPPKNRGRIILRGSIHGDEIPGTNTLLLYGSEIVERANTLGFSLDIHFCGNPYGFPRDRYNSQYTADLARGKKYLGNNDFLRYELSDGTIVDDLGKSNDFKNWYWSTDRRLKGVDLPVETRLAQKLLRSEYRTKADWQQVKAIIDLHADKISPGSMAKAAAYHYAMGDLSVYQPIVTEIKKIVPVWSGMAVGVTVPPSDSEMVIDENGFIVRHDGSLPDLAFREGVRQAITTETAGATPLEKACEVNLVWIFGIMDLLAKEV